MPAPVNTTLIDGSFEELCEELAQYLDNLRKSQSDDAPVLTPDVTSLLQARKKDDALKKLVMGSAALNGAPEREFFAAYNLLIYLVRQSPNLDMFLPRICQNLTAPITSSTTNAAGLALNVLGSLFNITSPSSENRFHIFLAIVGVLRSNSSFELLKPQVKHLEQWIEQWDIDDEQQRQLYLGISDAASNADDTEESYHYLLKALQTIPNDALSSDESRQLSLRALRTALSNPSHFDFQDLVELDPIQGLRKSDATFFELLEVFNSELLDEYNDFTSQHTSFLKDEKLDDAILSKKIRLLTLSSLAASTGQTRTLTYAQIASALQIPPEDVEMWVIDVIRAGLVEGKLSQLNQTFLIHRSTYRVFGENQWREVSSRLDLWKTSLRGVLAVIRQSKESVIEQKEQQARDAENKVNGFSGAGQGGDGERHGGHGGHGGHSGRGGRGGRNTNRQNDRERDRETAQQQPQPQAA